MSEKDPQGDQPVTRTEAEGATVDLPEGLGFFTTGQVLGDRYEILEMLGRGGMGEVWRAFDLKLRVEVGLKALRDDLFQSERRLELLRQEVRAAREVVSPNVCRIFDLIEIDGRELVSMEFVDGATLLGVLQERGPLELKEAQDIASQFLAGLEAIHKAGLVHRDVKPENIMLTRAGRVVVMDFGLARQETEGGGSVSGTPAYMAPEHAAGQDVDARADVYSAGVVLAEMVSPDGVKSYESRQSVWEGVRSEPAQVPDSPWAPVIKRAVARDRERRQNSAHTLIRELEDVTLRVEGAEDLHPYPGLASFTESDAEYFFGREAEIERMWRKLEGPPRMLGIMGPSGAGKTSFIRAGLTPNAPPNWAIIRCTPGNTAIPSLRGELTPELASGSDALKGLVTDPDNPDVIVEAIACWRNSRSGALLIVDQFEELFTLNSRDEQKRYATLLGRLPLEADVHVVVSMRDDFAASCNTHEALQPVFHELTVLDPPTGGNLRRALVQPATACGYRFEDDDLLEEMLAEVEGERGALPMLAFAAARLWEKRDRNTGLLTRQAYHDIGGVGGALARHAEATIDHIGPERIPIVRELFRNLVTAEGTRAVREWDELLSIFESTKREGINPSPTKNADGALVGAGLTPARDAASEVLKELIDARLLTSYEVREDEHEPTRRVEIIHESLLANWPRLVRWQTQDADAVQLRDQLRQAAKTWDEHDRSDDLLWAGSAYREFALWRERYPGGLTGIEEAFAAAMTSLATRRKRRRRFMAAAAVIVFASVALVFAGLWRRSVHETRRAEAEAKRAEAAKLLALGELQLEDYPTAALAWATSSLELADTLEARLLAMRALSFGPPVTILQPALNDADLAFLVFNSSGEWLATGSEKHTHLWFQDGSAPVALEGIPESPRWGGHAFVQKNTLITDHDGTHRFWSIPDVGQPIRVEKERGRFKAARKGGYFSHIRSSEGWSIFWWPTTGGTPRKVGGPMQMAPAWDEIDPTGSSIAFFYGAKVALRSLDEWGRPPRGLGELASPPARFARLSFHPDGQSIAAIHATNEIRIWPTRSDSPHPPRTLRVNGELSDVEFFPSGDRIAGHGGNREGLLPVWLFDLEAPQGVQPLELRRTETGYANPDQMAVHPNGDWLVVSTLYSAGFWPMNRRVPWVFDHGGRVGDVAFTPDGKWLLSVSYEGQGEGSQGQLRAWPLDGQNDGRYRVLLEQPRVGFYFAELVLHPSGEYVAVGSQRVGKVYLVSIAGGPIREFSFPKEYRRGGYSNLRIAFSPDGKLMAAVWVTGNEEALDVVVWDVETGKNRRVGEVAGETASLRFVTDRRLLWTGNNTRKEGGGEVLFDLDSGESKVLSQGGKVWSQALNRDSSTMVSMEFEGTLSDPTTSVSWTDLESGESHGINSHGPTPWSVALDPSGQIVATGGMKDGVVRVGTVTGEEPHLLYGHYGWVLGVAISPDERWIASAGNDKTIRLWPMPDLSKPPLHTFPHDELLAKLKTLTNLRVVHDEESPTGWKVEIGPFPGWETVPEW